MFCFPETRKLEIFFQKQDFYAWSKEKTDMATSNKRNG